MTLFYFAMTIFEITCQFFLTAIALIYAIKFMWRGEGFQGIMLLIAGLLLMRSGDGFSFLLPKAGTEFSMNNSHYVVIGTPMINKIEVRDQNNQLSAFTFKEISDKLPK
ncbi:MAG: hypothetical protein RL368_1435 [Pseudomonadota bacterium]